MTTDPPREPLSDSQNSSNNNPIRHAGRALVRGKFRRVWRPRYLEVRDNGLLSYYECPTLGTPTGGALDVFVETPTSSDDNKQPKCTLWIHHARVIDPTTLRDMHVGLPRGAYGFLFHGHRIDDGWAEATASMATGGEQDLLQDGLQLLSMGQACQGGNTIDATPRDFLCAVDSLEEAQSWVVALQWAASMGRDNSLHHVAPSTYTLPSVTWDHYANDGMSVLSSFTSVSNSLTASTGQRRQSGNKSSNTNQTEPTTTTSRSETPASPSKKSKQSNAASTKNNNNSNPGKMVVTKVVGYTLVRLETWKWEFAYRIQVLLVMPKCQVQEWSILRTAQNLELVVDKLKASLPKSTCQKLHIDRIRALPKLQQKQSFSANSVAVVDSVLRSFCMEASVVNSSVVKRFLGVNPNQTIANKDSPFWQLHSSTRLQSRPQKTILLPQESMDQYVKQWLQKRPKTTTNSESLQFKLLCWYLRLPQPATTYTCALLMTLGVSAGTLPTLNQLIRKFQILPYATVRLDVLLLSWCIAAGIGHMVALSPPTTKPPPAVSHKKASSQAKTSTPPSSPDKSSRRSSNSNKEALRVNTSSTPTKSLMDDEDDSQAEDGEEEDEMMDETSDKSAAAAELLLQQQDSRLSSPLPEYSTENNITESCWSTPKQDNIFQVRGPNYLTDRVKVPSGDASFTCRGVDMWMTDNPERHISRHPSVMGGQLLHSEEDVFLVNFLLPFGNFVSYFAVPPLEKFANPQLAGVWTRFIQGDQQYRDARLKLLPVVVDGPWIVRAAVPGTSPALLGKVIPLQYFFTTQKENGRSIYEVDVIITASSIAKGILSVVKGHAKALSIAFAFIIEAAEEHELPETVLASFQVNSLHLEDCPLLPECNLDAL